MDIYAPIAHRLGMAVITGELEDLSFRYLEPDAYFSAETGKRESTYSSNAFWKTYKTRFAQTC